MTIFGWIISIVGAAALSTQMMHLVERMEQPRRKRKAA